jgi:hypothetical protein
MLGLGLGLGPGGRGLHILVPDLFSDLGLGVDLFAYIYIWLVFGSVILGLRPSACLPMSLDGDSISVGGNLPFSKVSFKYLYIG